MKLPGAALLIVIGLVLLWLATSGQLDRLGKAWDYVKSGAADVPATTPAPAVAVPSVNLSALMDPATYHMQSMLTVLGPNMAYTNPGGLN